VAITVTNVQGWRRRHRELGHVALALAHVSRLKLEPNAFRLGRLSVTCVDRVQPDSLHNLGGVRVGLGLGCGCGRRLVTGSCVYLRDDPDGLSAV
jgi:hypothetical protein